METQNTARPDGCMRIEDFARRYGIQPATLKAHILVGLVKGGVKEHITVERRNQPLKGRWEYGYDLTLEQQRAA